MDESDSSQIQQPELRKYLTVIRKRKWTIGLVVLLGIAISLALSFRETPLYRAEARVLVAAVPGDETPPDVVTEAELINSDPVAELVKEEIGTDLSINALLSGLSVDPLPESDVVRLAYVAAEPEFAQQAATAFAKTWP